jgi:hypothetical protein
VTDRACTFRPQNRGPAKNPGKFPANLKPIDSQQAALGGEREEAQRLKRDLMASRS